MESQYEKEYHHIETDHFWFRARRRYIRYLLRGLPRSARVLDIGCSAGVLLNELREDGWSTDTLYGAEISEVAIGRCHEAGLTNVRKMDAHDLSFQAPFDIMVASDSLEHLQDDARALASWRDSLADDGVLLVFVPAFQFLWSAHDVHNHHYRRYRRRQLVELMEASGFRIEKASYMNFLLFFPAAFIRLLIRALDKLTGRQDRDASLRIPMLNRLFYAIQEFENRWLRVGNFALGLSVFCIARKAD